MNTNTLDAPVAAPSVWLGPDMARNPATWIYQLSNAELQEIAAAVSHARSIGLSIPTLAAEGFPLPHLAPKLRELLYEVQFGRGFVLIRGMGALNYGEEDLSLAYWGLGAYFGKPATQNAKGDVLGHVRDEGRKFGELDARGYHSNAHLTFHTDSSEIVGLLCVHPAKRGGLSSLVSSTSVYNRIAERHPEYLPVLYKGFRHIKREAAFSEEPVTPHRLPIYGRTGQTVSCRYVRTRIEAALTVTGETLSDLDRAALDFFDETSNDPALVLNMDFQPGDIQLINNYTLLHARTGFEDHEEPLPRRHLLRLWLTCSARRELPDAFPRYLGYGRESSELGYFPDWKVRQLQLSN